MKKLLSLIMSAMMIFSMTANISVYAENEEAVRDTAADSVMLAEAVSGECGDNLTWVLDEEGTLTISGTGDMWSWNSSSSVPWYSYRNDIKNITVNNGVTTIGSYAFSDCGRLTSITIPSALTSIGKRAFEYSSSLTDIYISDWAAWFDVSFDDLYSNPLFYVKNIYINGKRITDIIIPSGVTSIGNYAFAGYSDFTNITIPDGVTSIGDSAFEYCSGLTSITIPDSVTNIGNSAFSACSGLTGITIPPGVTRIRERAFYGCSDLKSITIPPGATSIDGYAFYGCSGLTGITIPDSVTSIGSYAFYDCTGLTSVYISDLAAYLNMFFADAEANPMCYANNLYVNNARVEGDLIIPSDAKKIPVCAFYGCDDLTSVTIPSEVTSIGKLAFSGCSGLTSITIPSGVISIGDYAFDRCTGLTDITADENNRYYASEDGVLFNKTKTETVRYPPRKNGTTYTIPDSVTSIGTDAFSFCKNLTHIEIPSGVTSIGGYAFEYCSGLTSLTIPSGVTSIEEGTFQYCSGLKSINIPNGVTNIELYAFSHCSGLTSLIIPSEVKRIRVYAFEDSGLNGITVDENNKYYASEAGVLFNKNKTQLVYYPAGKIEMTYVIPGSVTSISTGAFNYCRNLAGIEIPDSIKTIDVTAFSYCRSLTDVYYNGTISEWDDIYIKKDNDDLLRATIHYLSSLPDTTQNPSLPASTPNPFGKCGNNLTWELDNGTLIIDGTGDMSFAPSDTAPWEEYAGEIKRITVNDGVTSISPYAFKGCNIKNIAIPANMKSIGEGILADCDKLQSIKVPFIGENADPGMTAVTHKGVLGYFFGEGTGVKQGNKSYAVPESLTKVEVINSDINSYIPPGAFENCSNICDIVIYGGNSVYDGAFSGCTDLKYLNMPKSVSYIGRNILENCVNIETIITPFIGSSRNDNKTETSVMGAFFGGSPEQTSETDIRQYYDDDKSMWYHIPSSLKNVTVRNNTDIPYGALYGCKNVERVTIETGVVINSYAFYGCTSLKYISLPNNLREIRRMAFAECSSAESINIPKNARFIDEHAFFNAGALGKIIIPRSVDHIGSNAFEGTALINSSEDANSEDSAQKGIICAEGSYAQQYAVENNIDYKTADEDKLDIKTTSTTVSKHSDGAYFFDIIDTNKLSGDLFVVLYNDDGSMINIRKINASNTEYITEFTETESEGAAEARIFIWEIETMQPKVSEAEVHGINL
ncbi:MAG: leucine-rich repeat protein [Oscillospiraceae bacterium]|nr:leucine-rich repeat protein [Oscillospiraceae bacterium]